MGLIDVDAQGTEHIRRVMERESVASQGTARPFYVLGLDLGQTHDYSALTLDEINARGQTDSRHHIRHLQRWPLRTSYPTIVSDVAKMTRRAPLEPTDVLVIDQTGVGRPVVDMFRQVELGVQMVAVTITGGNAITRDGDEYHVPKRDLVSAVAVLLQSGRLRIASALPAAATLTSELETFQMKITLAANDTYGAWREGTNDDTVLATALAAWYGENEGPVGVYFL